jgi:hypothetical protein
MRPIAPDGPSQIHTTGLFLEKPGLLKEALKREEEWSNNVPGYDNTMGRAIAPISNLERSLFKLRAERELGRWAGQFIDPNGEGDEDDGSDGNKGKGIVFSEDRVWEQALSEDTKEMEKEVKILKTALAAADADDEADDDEEKFSPTIITNNPCITSLPAESVTPGLGAVPTRRDATLVIIRHGKTDHNKLGLFTGWEDAPLAKEGVEEAKEAGRLLKLHGFEFDVVYTSWLSRAVETAWHVLDEMDELWLPLIKTWRLNERMYGMLTGLSKNVSFTQR